MLGVTDYQRIRTGEPPVIGTNPDRDPGAEFTKFGWTLFGVNPLGKVGEDTAKQFFLRNGQEEFEKLCSSDVLGVTDQEDSTQFVHSDFKAQISRYGEGYYEARLPLKASQAVLPENKEMIKPTKVMTCMENSDTDQMLQKYTLTKLLRVTAFMRCFCANAKGAGYKGPLTTEEIQNAEMLWVRKMQIELKEDVSLPLQLNNTGIWRVNSRIQGYKLIYIPRGTGFDILMVRHFHQLIGHGGVSLTMGKVRERFWIPKLRTIVKSVWKLGQIEDEIKGKDGIVRGYKIKTGNGYIVERPLQLICDLEIGGKTSSQGNKKERDNNHTDSRETDANKRRRVGAPRLSKINARNRIAGIYKEEQENEDDD